MFTTKISDKNLTSPTYQIYHQIKKKTLDIKVFNNLQPGTKSLIW